jgi:transcriptional regulator with XRE-family HTH domain
MAASNTKTFSKNLRDMAKKRKRSHYSVAKEMNRRWLVSEQNVYHWFQGKYMPSMSNQKALCDVLKCSLSELMGW